MVSCQKGPTHHVYAWLIGPFWQDTLDMHVLVIRNGKYTFDVVIVFRVWIMETGQLDMDAESPAGSF